MRIPRLCNIIVYLHPPKLYNHLKHIVCEFGANQPSGSRDIAICSSFWPLSDLDHWPLTFIFTHYLGGTSRPIVCEFHAYRSSGSGDITVFGTLVTLTFDLWPSYSHMVLGWPEDILCVNLVQIGSAVLEILQFWKVLWPWPFDLWPWPLTLTHDLCIGSLRDLLHPFTTLQKANMTWKVQFLAVLGSFGQFCDLDLWPLTFIFNLDILALPLTLERPSTPIYNTIESHNDIKSAVFGSF